MNHDLAQKLKNAGFPQKDTNLSFRDTVLTTPNEYAYCPTLSELIEACHKSDRSCQFMLISTPAGWSCDIRTFSDAYPQATALNYPTPDEAVANLYLAIHKTNE